MTTSKVHYIDGRMCSNDDIELTLCLERELEDSIYQAAKLIFFGKKVKELPTGYIPSATYIVLDIKGNIKVDDIKNKDALIAMFIGDALDYYLQEKTQCQTKQTFFGRLMRRIR